MKTIRMAVYGTLKEGLINSHYMRNSQLLGTGKTKFKYELSASGIPFVNQHIPTSNVVVEVYDVPVSDLPAIDRLEGHPRFYERREIPVIVNGEEIKAWLYFCDQQGSTVILSGDYKDYRR